jgi:MYXO-CTERM domain-containing protein
MRSHLEAVRILTAAAWLLAMTAGVRRASACSPPAPPKTYAAIVGTTPAEGATNIPTNAPIVVELELHGGAPKQAMVSVFEEESGQPVGGTTAIFAWDRLFAAWRPIAPMRPGTRHRAELVIGNDAPRPEGAHGEEHVTLTFTTSDARVPPLDSQGTSSVRLEAYEREDWSRCVHEASCESSCGCSCVSTDARERLTRAHISLPSVTGGLVEPGYIVTVTAAESTGDVPLRDPPIINTLGTGSLTGWHGDASQEVVLDLEGSSPYKPCFWLAVSDLAGNKSGLPPVCLDETVQPPRKLPLGGADGCRVAGTGDATSLGLIAGLLGLFVARRRRRVSSRPCRSPRS